MSEADDQRTGGTSTVVTSGAQQPKHTEEVRFLVATSALRILLIGTPLGSALLFFSGMVDGGAESTGFHLLIASIFAVVFGGFLIYQIIKAGHLVLDPKRSRIVINGESISFRHLSNPQIGRHEVEFTSTQWHPMRGTGEGLQIAPGKTILFNTGQSRRKLQKIADILAEMLEEFEQKESARAAPRGADG